MGIKYNSPRSNFLPSLSTSWHVHVSEGPTAQLEKSFAHLNGEAVLEDDVGLVGHGES